MVENQIAHSELFSRMFFLKAPIENEQQKQATNLGKLVYILIPVFRRPRQEDCKFPENSIIVNQKTIASFPSLAT